MPTINRTSLIPNAVYDWMRSHARLAPRHRHMNYFGLPYCPECQKAGRDNVLRTDAAGGTSMVCSSGHRSERPVRPRVRPGARRGWLADDVDTNSTGTG